MVGHGNEDAQQFALDQGLPGIAVSDAHSIMEIGVAYIALDGDPSTPEGLLAALAGLEVIPGRATYFARLWTPFAKVVNRRARQRARRPGSADGRPARLVARDRSATGRTIDRCPTGRTVR